MWRRSSSEDIQFNPGQSGPKRRTRKSSRKIKRVFTTFSRLIAVYSESRNDFKSISRNYIYRHHVEPRVNLYVPREESFPIQLRYIDVTDATNATLDDKWNIERDRDVSNSWTRFTRFTILNEKKTPDR